MFQNIQNDQASYACITVSGFIFLRDAHWFVANRKEKVSSLLLLYKQARVWLDKYSTNWSPWQIDPRFSHKIARWRGGVGVQIERKISWGGGGTFVNSVGGGCWSGKKSPDLRSPEVVISVVAQQKNLYIWDLHQQASLPLAFSYCRFLQNVWEKLVAISNYHSC